MDISTEINGLKFKNPIMPASGCFGFGEEFSEFYDLNILGGIAIKSITPETRFGNPTPRVAETPSGMLNSIGLQNPGLNKVIENQLVFLEQFDTRILANVAGATEEDYIEVIEALNDLDVVDAFELNISCPNVNHGGIGLGTNPELAFNITKLAKKHSRKPLYVKLSPNVTNIVEIAQAVEKAGADAIVMINTLIGMKIDIKSRKTLIARKIGGLSGPAIRPIAIAMVYKVYEAVNIPIIGVGGIETCDDVIEFLMAGASAVQIGMQNFINPYVCKEIIEELPSKLKEYGFNSVKEVIGVAHE
ncbi:dihydroorotate dehydrogenase [Helcococcus ovis]|uniref:Dihydroorotate dehydrogenase n=1 Tax=Helcococcus ovis TaxID=72026 RepID=A0A4R9C2H2_9FIRM|nr:dihydroorotate dehydrogenase [Helcococcus ovis]TFF66147.1 dihydroorotate dehydrogenase [Helcococcus ovis]TFF66396.1 dihydroorotate dehydrogenase [Helcococcus ovis]TFF68709.1 dihydroorotate dehydrogenase [Helcococcus ovis]WNZ01650.1 dihydroorotate dehydrogenase [Helcococcus ovis]